MAVGPLARVAARGRVPVYVAIGGGARAAVEDLALSGRVALMTSPRHAGVLLVAGAIREEDWRDLRQLHDQLPHPRATVWWGCTPQTHRHDPVVVGRAEDPGEALASAYRELLTGKRESDPGLLPDIPPAPWRGRGDHGQGGEGMMGGTPYGRPMAMTGEDVRDGLALDAYALRLGPFLPMLPPGLRLELTLQGDVVQEVRVERPPFAQGAAPEDPLRAAARLLQVLELPALARRCLLLAAGRGVRSGLASLKRRIRLSGALRAIPPGLGEVGGADVRTRFRGWIDGEGAPTPAASHRLPRLADILIGLEWSEAVLVLNSFETVALRAICAQSETG